MNLYTFALMLHICSVALSGAFFLLRGVWMLQENPLLQAKPVRIAPHIIDTVLLVSALSLAFMLSTWPFQQDWLTAKLFALIAYIGLGVFTLRGKTKSIRTAAFIAALTTFAYIVFVALTRSASLGLT